MIVGSFDMMQDSALHHVKRANYQCFIWKHASFEKCLVSSVQIVIFFSVVFN